MSDAERASKIECAAGVDEEADDAGRYDNALTKSP
jgi:hypothetical protein